MGKFKKSQEKSLKIFNKHQILSVHIYQILVLKSIRLVENYLKILRVRLKLQNFLRILLNYLIFCAFFNKSLKKVRKTLLKSQKKFLSLTCGNPV